MQLSNISIASVILYSLLLDEVRLDCLCVNCNHVFDCISKD